MRVARNQIHPHVRLVVFVVAVFPLKNTSVDDDCVFFFTQQYKPPPPPSPEEIARREAEKAEEARWLERAKAAGPPEPPIASYQPGSSGL